MAEEQTPATTGSTAEAPAVQVVLATPNYHIVLWDEPPAYLCLLCLAQPPVTMTFAEVQAHVTTVHGVEPVPTPLAADPSAIFPPLTQEAADAPAPDVPHRDD